MIGFRRAFKGVQPHLASAAFDRGLNSSRQLLWLLLLLPALLPAQSDTLWSRRLAGTGNGQDQVVAMTADSEGNVYAAVLSRQSLIDTSQHVIITAKYSSSGVCQWSRLYSGPGRATPATIALDHLGGHEQP